MSEDRIDLPKWLSFLKSDAHYMSDFRPDWFGDKLGRTVLVDVLDGGKDYQILIEGSEIARRFSPCENRTFKEAYTSDYLDEIIAFSSSVVTSGNPAQQIFSVIAADGMPVTFSLLAMPAINRSGIVHRLVFVVDFLKSPPCPVPTPMFAFPR